MINGLIALSESEGPRQWDGANPYVVAAIVFAILLGLLIALMSFGGGRDHS